MGRHVGVHALRTLTPSHMPLQVDCLLVTPMTGESHTSSSGVSQGNGSKVWTGSADGTLLVWPDSEGKGALDASHGQLIRVEGGRGGLSHTHTHTHMETRCALEAIQVRLTQAQICTHTHAHGHASTKDRT